MSNAFTKQLAESAALAEIGLPEHFMLNDGCSVIMPFVGYDEETAAEQRAINYNNSQYLGDRWGC
jgi:hypothetical protein